MTTPQSNADPQPFSLGVNDILFILFRHKWKILLCAIAGLSAAVAVYLLDTPSYHSDAKLLVRYVVEKSAVDTMDTSTGSGRATTDAVLNSEKEILTSWDLAAEVAEAIGARRLVPGSTGASVQLAARNIQLGLTVTVSKGSNVVFVSYANADPALATAVLHELVTRYFSKHLEIHRSAGAFAFVSEQTDKVRGRLSATEDELKQTKAKAGIFSLAESTASLNIAWAKSQDDLRAAEAALAEQEARVKQLTKLSPGVPGPEKPPNHSVLESEQPSLADTQRYQALVTRLAHARQARIELLAKFTPENLLSKQNEAEIADLEAQRADLVQKFPGLASMAAADAESSERPQLDLPSEMARLAAVTARVATLKTQVQDLKQRAQLLSEASPQIAHLERQREVEETNYKYFQSSLEKARVDEALDSSKIPNISVIQAPSPALREVGKLKKILLGLAGGGLALGIALALLFELMLDRTIKRPLELETRLHIPLLLSIPYIQRDTVLQLRSKNRANGTLPKGLPSAGAGNGSVAPWDISHFIRPFAEAIGDRLGLFFELHNLKHKPKLVAVTSFSEGAGTSTVAGGLAAALSETGDGKVLLVDINVNGAEVHPFFEGKHAHSLGAALERTDSLASASDNLYLAMLAPPDAEPAQRGVKRLYDLLPGLKASDFDYVIFDMPPVSQTSPTVAMARFMDKILVVAEAEKSNIDFVQRAYGQLLAGKGKADVSAIFKKARAYGPKQIQSEL